MRTIDPLKHGAKRGSILDAAGRCFQRDGIDATSTKAICAEARISPGHLFHYFANKEEIVAAMAEARLEMYEAEFKKLIDNRSGLKTLLSRLEQGKNWTGRDNEPMLFDLLGKACRDPKTAKIVSASSHRLKKMMAELLDAARQRGELAADLDPLVAAVVVVTIFDGWNVMRLREGSANRKASNELSQLIRGYLKAPRGPVSR